MTYEYTDITNEKLASIIRSSGEWNLETLEELCDRAGLSEEWEEADGDNFEEVVDRAADILGVEIY